MGAPFTLIAPLRPSSIRPSAPQSKQAKFMTNQKTPEPSYLVNDPDPPADLQNPSENKGYETSGIAQAGEDDQAPVVAAIGGEDLACYWDAG